MALPQTTRAWVCNGAGDSHSPLQQLLRLEQRQLPPLKAGYALVRVDAAPVNPSDVMYVRGEYGIQPKAGDIPGFEGCGTVLAAHAGPYGWWLKGRRVSFGGQDGNGCWAEHVVVPVFSCIPVGSDMPVELAASLIVNPMTAIGLVERAKRHGAKALVMNAAGSSLGRFVIPLARRAGLRFIGIVRRPKPVTALLALGADHVLSTDSTDFDTQFRDLARQHQATVLLDAVAGDETGRLLRAMPDRSVAIVYGQLSQHSDEGRLSLDPDGLVFRRQRLEGYWLTHELEGVNGVVTPLLRARAIARLSRQVDFGLDRVHPIALDELAAFADAGLQDRKILFVRDPSALRSSASTPSISA